MSDDQVRTLIRRFKYWQVLIHPNQEYLGRCILWSKRGEALDFSDMTDEENLERLEIVRRLREALDDAFAPAWIDYLFPGNDGQHLRGHVVPRYREEVEFMHMRFIDRRWGRDFVTDSKFYTPPEVLEGIREQLEKRMIL